MAYTSTIIFPSKQAVTLSAPTKTKADDMHNPLTEVSPPMLRLLEMIRKVGSSRVPVLLQGESGTGMELVARAIYAARAEGAFVPIDCGSLVPTFIESELFGHEPGAFTGAFGSRAGLLQTAHGGTAFFDRNRGAAGRGTSQAPQGFAATGDSSRRQQSQPTMQVSSYRCNES